MTIGKLQERTVYVLSYFDPRGINTIIDQVHQIKMYSKFEIKVLNLFESVSKFGMVLPDPEIVRGSAGVLVHPTACYFPENLESLLNSFIPKHRPNGPVIVYKQDEHVKSHITAEILGRFNVDVLLTCVRPDEWDIVYPSNLRGNCRLQQVFTGYVSDYLLNVYSKVKNDVRDIDVFYRGSKQPPEIGRLGFEKYSLPRWAIEAASGSGLKLSVSSEWSDRLFGQAWFEALGKSKFALGNESGSNCFDFNGDLAQEVARFLEGNPSVNPYDDMGYSILNASIIKNYEGNVRYGQIAPRHLEAIATFTVQLLLPGSYSGLFEAGKHYLELNPDFSNFLELAEASSDPIVSSKITERAFEEILKTPSLHYRSFVDCLDGYFEEGLKSSIRLESNSNPAKKRVLLLVPHLAHLDPRIDWWKSHNGDEWDVVTVQSDPKIEDIGGVWNENESLFSAREKDLDFKDLPRQLLEDSRFKDILADFWNLEFFGQIWRGSTLKLCSFNFGWAMEHIKRVSVGLIEAGVRVDDVDLIVCADFPSLPAGIVLKKLFDVPLIYDAQEIWFQNLNITDPQEIKKMVEFEAKLLEQVEAPVTVSDGLAEWYRNEMNRKVAVLPNFGPFLEPESRPDPTPLREGEPVKYIFLGQFAPDRGVDKLIDAWNFKKGKAILTLQGPESEYKEYCRELINKKDQDVKDSIVLAPPTTESLLIDAASKHHVGIIPYTYNYPYSHCSPNKLTQYLNAGLMILSHDLPFVKKCIEEHGVGLVCNFNSQDEIRKTFDRLAKDFQLIEKHREKINNSVLETLSWDRQIGDFLEGFDFKKTIARNNELEIFPPARSLNCDSSNPVKERFKERVLGRYSSVTMKVGPRLRKSMPFLYNKIRPSHLFLIKVLTRQY